ncbi:hypothetical protein [Methylorubrum populi]
MIATAPNLAGAFRRLSGRSRRVHERYPCLIPGKILFLERGFSIDGVVNEVSAGGLRVRPALTYLLWREIEDVFVEFGPFSLETVLVNTTRYGYGLRLKSVLPRDHLEEILAFSQSESKAWTEAFVAPLNPTVLPGI